MNSTMVVLIVYSLLTVSTGDLRVAHGVSYVKPQTLDACARGALRAYAILDRQEVPRQYFYNFYSGCMTMERAVEVLGTMGMLDES